MFGKKCSLIGCVHVQALPGSAGYAGSMEKILDEAIKDANTYQQGGVAAIILENMHDVPYLTGYVDAETVAAMSVVANAVRSRIDLPLGVQLLAGANIEALGVAVACNLDFIRAEAFVFAHVGDEGMHDSCAAKLIRKRAHLKAENVKIFADIKKKHSAHAITGDISLAETAEAAEFFRADAVIVTGSATGKEPDLAEVESLHQSAGLPVLLGSGITADNIPRYAPLVKGLIVGSYAKYDGNWKNAVELARVKKLAQAIAQFN
ncbi:MAG TPA: BtpA/SgcQ family protein [Candidatus Melainabacteria bacterium]|nr:BtpA/SgcQ family protein [Candidatus Melainabacteria bacterium]